ncbi:MAG TPA: methyl-accepting chemotaxis protein [Coleofasciculaceae cyanobacterium]|jgi:twitching motility protein PilJ
MTQIKLPSVQSITKPSLFNSKERLSSSLEWFYNLPIKGKQLTSLFTSEVISVVGLVGVGAILIVASGRTQLLRQAEAELAVAATNYNIKLDQMTVGFRGQSDNSAVMTAAIAHSKGQSLTPELQTQVKQILQNEIEANNIEYATLVGKDLRIIVNGNTDRIGETFNPNNLVSEVFKNPKQIQASQIISWNDLEKESPSLPKGFAKQDALIRYTVTPVKDSKTEAVVGALVAGDIVNGKLPIVENTLRAFGEGYSAVYYRQPSGKFTLATSLDKGKAANLEQAQSGVPLADTSLLEKAVASPGKVVTGRAVAGTQSYTMATKAITDFSGKPVAVLVRGTSETALNKLLTESLLLQVVISALALAVDVILALWLGRTITQPIKQLQQTAQRFAEGDRQARAEPLTTDEVGQLANTFNYLADSLINSEATLVQQAHNQQAEAQRYSVFAQFTSRIYKSLNSEEIFATSVEEVRRVLQTDRVVVYRFNPGYLSGTITAESVGLGWVKAMGKIIDDPLGEGDVDRYRNGRISVCNDIYESELTKCHCEILERLQVKANMVAPILRDGELLALLCAHQCFEPRDWQQDEIFLFQQLAVQIGFALNQANLVEQLERSRQEAVLASQGAELVSKQVEQARQKAELNSLEQRQQKEALQGQVLDLLSNIEPSAKGDLTVRADVTESEIGTVADFFNSIIENLREIVMQVKLASAQVNTSLREDEQAVEQLSKQALKQAEEINGTLDAVEQITSSIIAVAENASQAATIARTASTAAEASGAAMDSTVEHIVNLQRTVVETANKVRYLGESSKEIAKVVALVQQIAIQTNLLAINAGIEASRAGEEGEGFRVVAAQIGTLATQAANATREIDEVIKGIQLGTKEVAEAMEEGKTQVVDGTRLVIDAKQNLEKIFEVSRQIDELVQSISSATVTQAQTSQIVTELMQEIAKTSQDTSDSSSKVSSSLRQTVEVAEKLQMSVGRFKIGTEKNVEKPPLLRQGLS